MANKILILGQSGTGKSTSIRNLDSKETYIIQVVRKDMPFKGWKKDYTRDEFNEQKEVVKEGNFAVASTTDLISGYLKAISMKRPYIKTVIIDDLQYIMSGEFMRRAKEKGYEKFTDIGLNAYNLLMLPDNLREDLTVVFLSHIENSENGEKMKTIGKMLDDKITPEGLFSIVLKSNCSDGKYYFETQNNGNNTIKSPMEMFEETEENDLKIILEKIEKYNN